MLFISASVAHIKQTVKYLIHSHIFYSTEQSVGVYNYIGLYKSRKMDSELQEIVYLLLKTKTF